MKTVKEIIEGLKIGSKSKVKTYKYTPKNETELSGIIKQIVEDEGGNANLNVIDTSQITNMSGIFSACYKDIEKIKINEWDVSNVKDMRNMFLKCENFDCDLSKWDVSNVTDMAGMFYKCKEFKGKGLDKWNVSKVEIMDDMFHGCKEFNQDISKWNVSKVKSMERIFGACHKFNQNLDSWDVKEDCNTEWAFQFCKALKNKPKWYKEDEED